MQSLKTQRMNCDICWKKSTRLANAVKQPKSGSIGFRFEKSSIVSLICFISNYINNYLPKLCTSSSCRRIVKTLVNFLGIGYWNSRGGKSEFRDFSGTFRSLVFFEDFRSLEISSGKSQDFPCSLRVVLYRLSDRFALRGFIMQYLPGTVSPTPHQVWCSLSCQQCIVYTHKTNRELHRKTDQETMLEELKENKQFVMLSWQHNNVSLISWFISFRFLSTALTPPLGRDKRCLSKKVR